MITVQRALEVPEGDGVTVRRLMPVHGLLNADPFVLWDHFAIGNGAGFPDHPHRGFEAITYIFSGGMRHADNLGNSSMVTTGGAQRFTAGRGLVHSEMPAPGETTAGIQLWINLPQRLKAIAPAYQQVDAAEFPEQAIEGGTIRTLVGKDSPLILHTPVEYLDIRLAAGSELERAIPTDFRGFLYIVEGAVTIDEKSATTGQAILVENIASLGLSASQATRLMWCFGKPHGEPIRQHGPYVD